MKKKIIVLLIGLLCFAACSTKKDNGTDNGNNQPGSSDTTQAGSQQGTQTGNDTGSSSQEPYESKNKGLSEADYQNMKCSLDNIMRENADYVDLILDCENKSSKNFFVNKVIIHANEGDKEIATTDETVGEYIKPNEKKRIDLTIKVDMDKAKKGLITYTWEIAG